MSAASLQTFRIRFFLDFMQPGGQVAQLRKAERFDQHKIGNIGEHFAHLGIRAGRNGKVGWLDGIFLTGLSKRRTWQNHCSSQRSDCHVMVWLTIPRARDRAFPPAPPRGLAHPLAAQAGRLTPAIPPIRYPQLRWGG
jgi:hypothetical protein